MKKHIFTVSDIEMGKKDKMDDFHDEKALINFIDDLNELGKTEESQIVLIFNGDTFDFLKMDYKGEYPRYISEEISAWKTDKILQSYEKIFAALKDFLKNKNNTIHFIFGNHDFDLLWPSIQKKIRQKLVSKQTFFSFTYETHDLHIEHGNLNDIIYSIDTEKIFVNHKNKPILNLPFGAYAVSQSFIELKKRFSNDERLYPRKEALNRNKDFKKMSRRLFWKFTIIDLLLKPLYKFRDKTHRVPYLKIIKHVLHNGITIVNDHKMIENSFKKLIKEHPDKKTFILGHAHVYSSFEYKNRLCLITDTWREEYDITTEPHKRKPKTYAHILYENDQMVEIGLKEYHPTNI